MQKKYPNLSIIIVNRNSAKMLNQCLNAIKKQEYPESKIEILVIDGSSTDNSKEISEKYGAKFIEGGFSDNMEARRFVGVKNSENEILVFIDTDNYLPYASWLQDMTEPFDDDEIFASQTLRYKYRKEDTILNRYNALFGANDPVAFYFNKQDRLPYYYKNWKLKGEAADKGKYYKIKISDDLSTIGCNGFLIRKKVLEKVLTVPENFFHTDIILDLVKLGYCNIAVVKNDIIHETSDSLKKLIRKRTNYFENHVIKLSDRRRYKIYDSKNMTDNLLLLKYIIFTVTIIKPVLDSFRGFIKKADVAWFVHPIICFVFLYSYGYVTIKRLIFKI